MFSLLQCPLNFDDHLIPCQQWESMAWCLLRAWLWLHVKHNAHILDFHVTIFWPQTKESEPIILWIFRFWLDWMHHILYMDYWQICMVTLHIKLDNRTCIFNFMKVKLQQQVALPWEAPSQNIVLNVFNCELTFVSFDPTITIGITYPFILASLSIGLVVDFLQTLYLFIMSFPNAIAGHNK